MILYSVLFVLTVPVFVYALSCHIMWVCFYAGSMALISTLLSVFVIKEMQRRQRRLTSDVAHELRTPLACLRGEIEGLQDGVWAASPERLASCLEEIERLTKLVSDLSLLTDLEWENVKLAKTDFDLSELLREVGEQFRGQAVQKGLELDLALEPWLIHADKTRVRQVFVNLVANALKYTDKGTVRLSNHEAEAVVEDTGIGISSEALPRVFERFYRADSSRTRDTGGSGIGLALSRALVGAHGGTICVESTPGQGSRFYVRL